MTDHLQKVLDELRDVAFESPYDERLCMPDARIERHKLALLVGYVDGLRQQRKDNVLLIEPLETAALMFEEKLLDDAKPYYTYKVTHELLKLFCGSIRQLSEALRK